MPRQTFRQRRDAGISATVSKISRDSVVTSDGYGELIVPRQPTAQEMFASALDILTPEEQEERYDAFPEDPVEFIQDVLGIYLWKKQREIVYSVFNNRYTSVASCHAAGKTFSTAALILAFLNMKRNSIALSTAPTGRQVEHVLWRNIRRIYAEAKKPLLGNVPLTTRYDIAEQWYGIGFKPTDSETDPLQGFHADDILAVIDEAAGVVPVLIDGLQAAMTSEGAHMLQIGNPTSTAGPFFDSHHSQSDMWETFVIAAKDTPNFTGEPYPVPGKHWTGLITPEWVDEVVAKYGEGSAYVESRVHARFVSNEDVLIPLALIEAAEQPRVIQESGVHEAGVDVARAGKDKSVLTIRNGSVVKPQWELASGDSFKTADDVLSHIRTHGYPNAKYRIKVDETGVGAGVVDALKFRIRDNNLPHVVIPVNFGAKASDPEAFFNQRCEMFINLAERFMKSNIYFPEPPKYQMKTELSDIRTNYDGKHTQPIIERKDDFRKRVGKSPDYADSLALAFYQPPRDIKKIGALSFGYAENRWGRQ